MTFRDDREAAHRRAAALEEELARTRRELEEARAALAQHESKDERDEAEIARLRRETEARAKRAAEAARSAARGGGREVPSQGTRVAVVGTITAAVAIAIGVRTATQHGAKATGGGVAAPRGAEGWSGARVTPGVPAALPPGQRPAAPEPVSATIAWRAQVARADGASVRVGDACEVAASVRSDGAQARDEAVRVRCGAEVLYDSAMELGMSATMHEFGLREGPAPGGAGHEYALRYLDSGMRTGPRAQADVHTEQRRAAVWREGAVAWRVELIVDEVSDAREGPRLTNVAPGARASFGAAVERVARVRRVEGPSPVREGARCRFTARPTWSAGGFNCRLGLACDGRWVYGAERSGFNRCALEGDRAVSAEDSGPSATDHDPMLTWQGARLVVADDAGAERWRAEFALESPGEAGADAADAGATGAAGAGARAARRR